jgi:hypothetical protein
MADVTDQLQLNLKINEAIKERSSLMEKQRGLIVDQIALQRELCNAIECIDADKMNDGILKTKESLNALFEATNKVKNVSNDFNKTGKAAGGLAAGATAANKVFGGMGKIVGSVTGKISTFVKGAWSIVKSLGQVAKSIISIPFKAMEGLIDLSNKFGVITEYARALEDVREKFGDLEKGTGRILKNSMKPMQEQFGKLTAAGHGFAATFGVGPEGTAAAIRFNAELMEKLNGATEKLRNEIGENIGAMAIYRKGMGFTADQQATLIALADAQGKSITGVQHEYAKFSLQMGKRFGLDSKLIGKSMADMTADVGNFGTLSTRQLAQVATYTQKLGIETKALQGVIKKYDDFESAAKSAAMLNQTFGMQVDVMKLMKDEDPASRLSQLQKSFQATGKSYEKLSRAERNRLADLAGLDAKSAELAFSQKGLSMSYDDIQSAGEESETSFADINDTLKELSKNMKKLFTEPQAFKNFFGAFSRGFNKGIIRSQVFMGLMKNLRGSLRVVEKAGKEIGKAFVEMFPGVNKMLTGLKDFFNPSSTAQRMSKVVASFKNFFEALKGGPKEIRKAMGTLWQDLMGNFTGFFGDKSGATSDIMSGLQTFAGTLGNIALGFMQTIMKNVSKALNVVKQFFENMKTMSFGEALSEAIGTEFEFDPGGWFSSQFGEGFSEIGTLFVDELWPSIRDAFLSMWDWLYKDVLLPFWDDYLKPWLKIIGKFLWEGIKDVGGKLFTWWWDSVKESFSKGNYGTAAAIFLTPLIILFGGLATTLASAFITILGPSIGKGLKKLLFSESFTKTGSKMASKLASGFAKTFGKLASKIALGPLAVVALAVESGMNASEQMQRMGEETVEKFGLGATKSAAGLAGVIQTLTLGLLPESIYNNLADWFAEFFGGGEQDGFIGMLKLKISTVLAIITDLLMGIGDAFRGIWDFLMGILTLDFGRMGLGIMKFFSGIGNALMQVGFTIVESVLQLFKKLVENAKRIPFIGGKIPDGAIEAIDEFIGKAQSAASEQAQLNSQVQNMKSESQMEKEAKARSAQQQNVEAATPEQEAQEKLSTMRAADTMLREVEKLKGVEAKLEAAIKDMPTDDKIQLIKSQAGILIENMNKTFKALKEELDNAEFDEFKADMFDNSIVSNIQNIVSIKESISKLASEGPKNEDLENSMKNLVSSLEIFRSNYWDIELQVNSYDTTQAEAMGYAANNFLLILASIKSIPNALNQFGDIKIDPSNIETNMTNLNLSLEKFKNGVDDLKNSLQSTIESSSQLMIIVEQANHNPFMIIRKLSAVMHKLANSPIVDSKMIKDHMINLFKSMNYVNELIYRFTIALPDDVLSKVKQTVNAIEYIGKSFEEISNKEVIATAIKIGESFKGNSEVTFKHENININLAVKVEMSAEDLLRGLIKTTVKGTEGKADKEVTVVTDPSDPFGL